jgi:periplasmic protein TonB
LRRADPVPAPPALVADEGLTFTLPVQFRSKDRK